MASNDSIPLEQHTPLERIYAIGFVECGEWRHRGNHLFCQLSQHADAKNVLYAFVAPPRILYVGKTIRPLRARLQGYERPGPTQFTNVRGRAKLLELLKARVRVQILALPDDGLLRYGGFHMNLAAGLEDSLVKELQPEWNVTGKKH